MEFQQTQLIEKHLPMVVKAIGYTEWVEVLIQSQEHLGLIIN